MRATYPIGSVRALIDGELVTAPTRRALSERLARADVAVPWVFDAGPFATLRANPALTIMALSLRTADRFLVARGQQRTVQ